MFNESPQFTSIKRVISLSLLGFLPIFVATHYYIDPARFFRWMPYGVILIALLATVFCGSKVENLLSGISTTKPESRKRIAIWLVVCIVATTLSWAASIYWKPGMIAGHRRFYSTSELVCHVSLTILLASFCLLVFMRTIEKGSTKRSIARRLSGVGSILVVVFVILRLGFCNSRVPVSIVDSLTLMTTYVLVIRMARLPRYWNVLVPAAWILAVANMVMKVVMLFQPASWRWFSDWILPRVHFQNKHSYCLWISLVGLTLAIAVVHFSKLTEDG